MKRKKPLAPKVQLVSANTSNQKEYARSIIENKITLCCGPAGSGKSFIVSGIAAEHLHKNKTEQIIVTRPLICTGRDIGSLPGELREKIDPYLTPIQENFKHFLGPFYGKYLNERRIRYEPLEVMRGSTFHNSYMILDEAQNCTFEQIKMFLTRIGENSKVIINGDINQTDLNSRTGLELCMNKLESVDEIGLIKLDYSDIQRNDIITKLLIALES